MGVIPCKFAYSMLLDVSLLCSPTKLDLLLVLKRSSWLTSADESLDPLESN